MTVKLAILLSLALAFVTLSGCLGSDQEGTDKAAANTEGTGGLSDPDAPPTNAAPSLNLEIRVSGVASGDDGTVVAPPNEAITFDASGASDPDGDELDHRWYVDEELQIETDPTFTIIFDQEGEHDVRAVVTDGQANASATTRIVIQIPEVEPPEEGAGDVTNLVHQFNGTYAAADGVAEAASVTDPFVVTVPEGAIKLHAALRWSDDASVNTPLVTDLDLYALAPSGSEADSSASFATYEYVEIAPEGGLSPGDWTFEVVAYHVPVDTDWTLEVAVWLADPEQVVHEATHAGSARILGLDAETAPDVYAVNVPAKASLVVARLAWQDPAGEFSCDAWITAGNDYDLYVYQGESEVMRSADGVACEFAFTMAAQGETFGEDAEWTFEVVPFLVTASTYQLVIEFA